MTQTLNGAAAAETQLYGLTGLSAHLTDPADRETYASLISYFHSLPPGDELLRLAQLLGFLSLLAQRLPDILSGFLATLKEQTETAGEYHLQLEKRLAQLPVEIAAGVDLGTAVGCGRGGRGGRGGHGCGPLVFLGGTVRTGP